MITSLYPEESTELIGSEAFPYDPHRIQSDCVGRQNQKANVATGVQLPRPSDGQLGVSYDTGLPPGSLVVGGRSPATVQADDNDQRATGMAACASGGFSWPVMRSVS